MKGLLVPHVFSNYFSEKVGHRSREYFVNLKLGSPGMLRTSFSPYGNFAARRFVAIARPVFCDSQNLEERPVWGVILYEKLMHAADLVRATRSQLRRCCFSVFTCQSQISSREP
jgi:hypothetical protein